MRRLLLLTLLLAAAISAQDKTPYKFMFGGNSYYGSRNATVQWLAERYDVPAAKIGTVTPAEEGFNISARDGSVGAGVAEMADAYFGALSKIMDSTSQGS